ncbi:SCO family protein [Pelagibacterium lentulum]|uniref:Photosynthetic protein synthase I n=2 Tax=Pelagibacterium lentulum TaxID=2029865 RepID=A0A916RGA1_9HYPH|nr:SCO family protein [Pelagibacterium lentulum]GGA55497.1 photosynthetic protein synthase I [Pelagibacterium lentulum]
MLAKVRIALWGLVALAAISATVIYFTRPFSPSGTMFGGPFEMTATTTGEPFTQDDLVGTPSLMFFGFTYCPDVCPMTLAEATAWKQELGLGADDLNIIFVTVDPERDTIEHLATYLSNFDEDVFGLVGNQAQTDQIKRSYGVFSEVVEPEGSTDYLVNHTSSLYMIDAQGEFFGTIAFGESSDTAKDKIRRLTSI